MEWLWLSPFILLAGYIVWRLITYGAMRSYFQAKLWFYRRLNDGSRKKEINAGRDAKKDG